MPDLNREQGLVSEPENQPPWVPPARTGWAARQSVPEDLAEVCHCGEALTACARCGTSRCLACEPVQPDDCRWSL
jgi:hypothetical protein